MAIALLSHEVCDLTLGKPSLCWVAATASVRAALITLKRQDEVTEISVWSCAPGSHAILLPSQSSASDIDDEFDGAKVRAHQHRSRYARPCHCIGKVCMQKIICYLASEQSMSDVVKALDAPVTVLLNNKSSSVQHIDADASMHEALSAIIRGVQNLVVPITGPLKRGNHLYGNSVSQKHLLHLIPKGHNGQEYCWLTHEDVLRFLLGSISVFSPLPMISIKELGIIRTDVMMVGIDEEAKCALEMIKTACLDMTAVAVVRRTSRNDAPPEIVGEISCLSFQACDEMAAVALAALSVRDFLTFIQDWRSMPDMLLDSMSANSHKKLASLKDDDQKRHELERHLKISQMSQMLHEFNMWDMSSDDEFATHSPTGPHDRLHKHCMPHTFHSGLKAAKAHLGPIFCRPTSSLIAVLMQALAHRISYVWVTNEDDNTLIGMVSLADIISVLSKHLNLML